MDQALVIGLTAIGYWIGLVQKEREVLELPKVRCIFYSNCFQTSTFRLSNCSHKFAVFAFPIPSNDEVLTLANVVGRYHIFPNIAPTLGTLEPLVEEICTL